MMPPTGMTLIVHATVIVMKSIANIFHRPFCEKTYAPETTAQQTIASFAIMTFIFMYVTVLIGGFVYRALADDRATWRILGHVMSTQEAISPHRSRGTPSKSPPFAFLEASGSMLPLTHELPPQTA